MAQQLYERHSLNVHLNTVKRHIRLSRQVKGAEDLITAIEPFYNELVAKSEIAANAASDAEFKRDILWFKDALLDDKVRDVFEACKKYDRDYPEKTVSALLFPNGASLIIYAPLESEPTIVEKLIMGIQNLGAEHSLAAYIEPLQTAINDTKAAIYDLHAAIIAEKNADALTSIAKVNLMRQYEQNIYAASARFGKEYSNRLFPAIKSVRKTDKTEEKDLGPK